MDYLLIGFTIMMLWLEILGGRAYFSLQDLVGGQFWKSKPSLGFHGAWIPQFGCQGHTWRMRETYLQRPRRHHGWRDLALACQTFFLGETKCHLWRLEIMLEGLEVVMSTHGRFWRKEPLDNEDEGWIGDTWPLEAQPYHLQLNIWPKGAKTSLLKGWRHS